MNFGLEFSSVSDMIRGHSTDSETSFSQTPKRVCGEDREDGETDAGDHVGDHVGDSGVQNYTDICTVKDIQEVKMLILDVKSSQASLRNRLDSKFDSVHNKMDSLQETLQLEMGRLEGRIQQVEGKLSVLESKVETSMAYSTDSTLIIINLRKHNMLLNTKI